MEEERWKIKEWEGKTRRRRWRRMRERRSGEGVKKKKKKGRCSWDGAEGTGRTGVGLRGEVTEREKVRRERKGCGMRTQVCVWGGGGGENRTEENNGKGGRRAEGEVRAG